MVIAAGNGGPVYAGIVAQMVKGACGLVVDQYFQRGIFSGAGKGDGKGGFAGIRIATDLKLDDLPDEQAHTISELLDDLDFRELPASLVKEEGMADQFTYTITVETKKWQHTVITGDISAPEKLQELLQLLNRLARTPKRQ